MVEESDQYTDIQKEIDDVFANQKRFVDDKAWIFHILTLLGVLVASCMIAFCYESEPQRFYKEVFFHHTFPFPFEMADLIELYASAIIMGIIFWSTFAIGSIIMVHPKVGCSVAFVIGLILYVLGYFYDDTWWSWKLGTLTNSALIFFLACFLGIVFIIYNEGMKSYKSKIREERRQNKFLKKT
jgi:hypothetical protein